MMAFDLYDGMASPSGQSTRWLIVGPDNIHALMMINE